MPKTRQQKETAVKDYAEKLKTAKGVVFANFDGLKVKEIEELRKKCRQLGIDYVVAKKTLMRLAFKDSAISDIDPVTLNKGVATVFSYNDEVASAKTIGEFAKTHEALKPVGGILEKKFIDAAKVITLSKLPSRNELLAKLLGSIKSPVSGLVNVLSGNLRNLVYVLSAIKNSKS